MTIRINIYPGCGIDEAARLVVDEANRVHETVHGAFNGVDLVARPDIDGAAGVIYDWSQRKRHTEFIGRVRRLSDLTEELYGASWTKIYERLNEVLP